MRIYADGSLRSFSNSGLCRITIKKEDPSLPKADVVIGADTVVVVDNKVLEKPHDAADAKRMLRMLSGRSHETLTGVQILIAEKDGGGYKQHSFVECTRVRFFEIDDETLDACKQRKRWPITVLQPPNPVEPFLE